jgi:hypothetical protein
MLVLADRNFQSHTLARDVLATGAHILWRGSASFALTPTGVLADRSYLAQLNPARKSDGPSITVRVIEYNVHTTTPASGGLEGSSPDWLSNEAAEEPSDVFALVTDLLDIQAYPAGLSRAGPRLRLPDALERRDRDRPSQDRHGRGYAGMP